jgi:hypothetical protein
MNYPLCALLCNYYYILVGISVICVITSLFCGSGSWSFASASNGSSRFVEFEKSRGDSILELLSTPTKISGVHYVQVNKISFKWFLLHLEKNPYHLRGYTCNFVLFMITLSHLQWMWQHVWLFICMFFHFSRGEKWHIFLALEKKWHIFFHDQPELMLILSDMLYWLFCILWNARDQLHSMMSLTVPMMMELLR